jgi:hypothetical protein
MAQRGSVIAWPPVVAILFALPVFLHHQYSYRQRAVSGDRCLAVEWTTSAGAAYAYSAPTVGDEAMCGNKTTIQFEIPTGIPGTRLSLPHEIWFPSEIPRRSVGFPGALGISHQGDTDRSWPER